MSGGLRALYEPGAVAVFGSTAPGRLGAVLLERLLKCGFPKVYAVNPKGLAFGNAPGFGSVRDIPAQVDLAVIASPAHTVAQVLRECGEKGVQAAVIITSGFGEARHPELEAEVQAVAKQYGIRYIGPNCSGMVNTHWRLQPTLEAEPLPGRLALISQSGAVGGLVMSQARLANIGVSKFISFGNGGDLAQTELLLSLKDDPDTAVIAMYAENIKDGRAFLAALSQVTPAKPVVIVKSGRSQSGRRAALSHTGSLAGSDAVYDAAFAAGGAIRAESIQDLLDICKGLILLPRAKGRRLAVITNSGGPGVMSVDFAEGQGLQLPEPSPELKARFSEHLPAFAGLANPIDVTVEGTPEQYRIATELALEEADLALVIYVGTPYLAALPVAEAVAAAAKNSGKPVACHFQVGYDIGEAQALLDKEGCPDFPSPEQGVRALAMLAESSLAAKAAAPGALPLPAGQPLTPPLLEPEIRDLLAGQGVAFAPHVFATSREQVAGAAEQLGYPLVMKIVSPQILHKSDVGGVKLNLKDQAAALAAFDALAKIGQGKDFRGALMAPMLPAGREIIVGFRQDPQFGPVIMAGLGGIYTEILQDIALRIAPVGEAEALAMLKTLKTWPLLDGARGAAKADVQALARLIAAFSRLPFIYPELEEGELNPVFVWEQGVAAVDARLILK